MAEVGHMARPKNENPPPTTKSRYVRQFLFDETLFKSFEQRLESRSLAAHLLFKNVVKHYLDGLFITVDTLQPNTVTKLREYAKTLTGNDEIQVAVTAVLNQWAQQQEPKGKR